jgi:8-amino-7-oxononanoate synthase
MKIYPTSALPGRKVLTDNGAEYLWFSGTDYLGMGHHEEFLTYLEAGISQYGSHYGSSRNNSLRLTIYEKAEMALANYAGAPMALTTASGMWAGQLLIKELPQVIAAVLEVDNFNIPIIHYHYAPGVHPALWGPSYKRAKTNWELWAEETVSKIKQSRPDDVHVILSDSVRSPFVESFDFSIFKNLPFYRQIFLVADDSHGLGVLGKGGSGVYQTLSSIQQVKLIVVSSLNKALGVPGGVIFAEENMITTLRRSPFFAGASPGAPAYMYALEKLFEAGAYPLVHEQLLKNTCAVADELSKTKLFVHMEDYPVFCSLDGNLFDFLENNGILTSCFSYPQPTDPPVTRVVISAIHQKEDLDRLAEVCMKF